MKSFGTFRLETPADRRQRPEPDIHHRTRAPHYSIKPLPGTQMLFYFAESLTSVPMRLGLMYRLSGADTGNHSLSIDTKRSMPPSSRSESISGRPIRFADAFNLCKLSSGRNRFMWPCTVL